MDEKRPLRPRIAINKTSVPENAQPAIEDEADYKANLCTANGKRHKAFKQPIVIDLWFDKHYHTRLLIGDDDGKRNGIDIEAIESLVSRSIPYLFLASSTLTGFKFNNIPGSVDRKVWIVLQEQTPEGMLNAPIQCNMLDSNTYEVTVTTAMVVDGFKIEENQYALELIEGGALVKKMVQKTVKTVIEF